jgi:hypothetical protein
VACSPNSNGQRVLAGLARKRLEQTDARKVAAIRSLRAEGTGLRRISRELGVGVGTAIQVLGETSVLARNGAELGGSGLL